jgi:ferritin-like protein
VKVDELLELLVKNSSAELTTYYYYTILRVNLIRDGTFPSPLLMSVYCMR